MIFHVVVTDAWVFICDELQVAINRRLVTSVDVALLPDLARVCLLILAWTRRESVVFEPAFGVCSKSMHFLFVCDPNSVLIGLVAH